MKPPCSVDEITLNEVVTIVKLKDLPVPIFLPLLNTDESTVIDKDFADEVLSEMTIFGLPTGMIKNMDGFYPIPLDEFEKPGHAFIEFNGCVFRLVRKPLPNYNGPEGNIPLYGTSTQEGYYPYVREFEMHDKYVALDKELKRRRAKMETALGQQSHVLN